MPFDPIHVDGKWIKDPYGRTLLLRGANLSGSTKVPYTPDGASYRKDAFYDHRTVSFIGKPFPLSDADEHFRRLREWGMLFLRFLVTWEAIEHAGPGEYDEAYLDYVRAVVQKAGEYDIRCFIDPHQDVWSRWTGGDGAPGWTLEAVGFDLTKLDQTGAAITHQNRGDPFPRMIWPTNYSKLGAATMFTLFFAGNDFAPNTRIDGEPVQDYLQRHYLDAIKQVALRLRDLPNVVGYDALNEPMAMPIGQADIAQLPPNALLLSGESPTLWQAILAGSGYPQEVGVYQMGFSGLEETGKSVINPDGVNVWRDGFECVWKANGVWADADGTPQLLRPAHFAGKDFTEDYLKPFVVRFINEIRTIDPDALLFLEGAPGGAHPSWTADDPGQTVNAGHWYDALTLFMKQFNPEFTVNLFTREPVMGEAAVADAFVQQLGAVKHEGDTRNMPTLIGEFGLPFDLDEKSGYRSSDFSLHTRALDLYYDAMDANLLHCTIWNYTPDNTNARGDLWNDEDLSIFSRDQQHQSASENIHSGGRGLDAFVRPYALATAGEPLSMRYDHTSKVFELRYHSTSEANPDAPTEIFVPNYVYPNGYQVALSDGRYEQDTAALKLLVWHSAEQTEHSIRITPHP
jgi:hypothetical protein